MQAKDLHPTQIDKLFHADSSVPWFITASFRQEFPRDPACESLKLNLAPPRMVFFCYCLLLTGQVHIFLHAQPTFAAEISNAVRIRRDLPQFFRMWVSLAAYIQYIIGGNTLHAVVVWAVCVSQHKA